MQQQLQHRGIGENSVHRWTVAYATFFVLLSITLWGCRGALILSENPEGRPCVVSGECGEGYICGSTQSCEVTEEACSTDNAAGYCPLGRSCSAGVCLRDDDERKNWCGCTEGESCAAGVCMGDGSSGACSTENMTGSCAETRVCVGGTCVPLSDGNNTCSKERPTGLCPVGAGCRDGYCVPLGDEPCNTNTGIGLCAAGQSCSPGGCVPGACSSDVLFGACAGELLCLEGECLPPAALLTCSDLDCVAQNRQGCDDTAKVPVCLACALGFHEQVTSGVCVRDGCAEFGCVTQNRLCDTSGGVEACGDCMGTFIEDGTSTSSPKSCRPRTCAELACAALQRECDATAVEPSCGACLRNLVEGANGVCVEPTCSALNCEALGRVCVENNNQASCGKCLGTLVEAQNGSCVECESSSQCPTQNYCSVEGKCVQDCTGTTCANGDLCSPYGRCLATTPSDAVCGVGLSEGERVVPTVMLLVDRSGSMKNDYSGNAQITRWKAVGEALFGVDGVVRKLENDIAFGMALYTERKKESGCPDLVPPISSATGNFQVMKTAFDAEKPRSETPTGESIRETVGLLKKVTDGRPQYIVLATDGLPDLCSDSKSTKAARDEVLKATKEAFDAGIKLFSLFIGVASDKAATHMQEVANVGAGFLADGSNGQGIFFEAQSPGELSTSLGNIIGSVATCSIQLTTLGEDLLRGTVYLDGDALPRAGWQLLGRGTTLQLLDPYCTQVKDGNPHFIAVQFDICGGGG